jgi:hypothetical protein
VVNFCGLWLGNSSHSTPAHVTAPGSDSDENQSAAPLTQETKDQIVDEVQAELKTGQADSAAGSASSAPAGDRVPAALDPNQRVFIVSTALTEQTTDGGQCLLSPGDILTRTSNIPDGNQNVSVVVTSSQKHDCARRLPLKVSIQDLQDMHNDFLQKMDAGLKQLAANQGKKGMPASPNVGANANPEGQADPDPTTVNDLQQQEQEANAAEKEVNQTMNSGQ